MALTGLGGVTSSVLIQTQTLWYGDNLYDLLKIYTFVYIPSSLCEIHLFLPYTFC
jgi:hypothetical protein